MLESVIVNTSKEHKASVIWLHGLGDSGDGFAPIVPEFQLPDELGVKFIFPHAPVQPVTINNGMQMRSWYDIKSMELDKRADEQGVRESAQKVQALIEAELAAGIPADKIVLAGFSQGGVVSLHLAPRLDVRLAGVLALSTYMCVPEKLASETKQSALNIFMAHGSADNVVPMSAGRAAFDVLATQGHDISWQDYPMQHQVCMEEIKAIRSWLIAQLG